jgi:hypothetical protein
MRATTLLAAAIGIVLAGAGQAKDTIRVPVQKSVPPQASAPAPKAKPPAPAAHRPVHVVRKPVHRTRMAATYYDYYQAREVREDIAGPRNFFWNSSQQDDDSGYASNVPVTINSRDFSGGVGYGQNGDLGYPGGYGRFEPYNGNAGMNGAAAPSRFSPRHR